ncbi:MAG: PhzF family phenazine biosynthesis protein [Rhodospirillaceae bacterium]|nr:PhzF family phenazine biosynthesis protein [Rhodospirillaceae bacterium]MBT6205941.1 PhzF family phenazine biosynthesis protein [Rhodospirillaceae bacterium]MBT7612918.1 PhzF family phenazine biosynthesis protein [Rhodospirillaceae bacterium]MBT7647488.1 PhzF family phenazine biosynthesis protein [Rhodospirillaceae bacterium]
MRYPLYQVDAFTGHLFGGNPAAVMPLEEWLRDDLLQEIAAENNLAETAFFRPGADEAFELRWFTPTVEVDLCGHATLATAFILMTEIDTEMEEVAFDTRSGRLFVRRKRNLFILDFPSHSFSGVDVPGELADAVGAAPSEAFEGPNYLFVYEHESDVATLEPDFSRLGSLLKESGKGITVTAPRESGEGDAASRYFAPAHGIPEDPVTGSAHCMIAPYWAQRLGKSHIHALQISKRGGELFCTLRDDRVEIAGRAVKYLEGIAHIPG